MILGMVVTAVIMVVGQSLERAFAILANQVIGGAVLLIARLDPFAPTRATHLLRIRVANTVDYDRAYREPFGRLFRRAELRAIESAQSKTMTELRHAVNLRPGIGQRDVVTELSRREGVDRVLMLEPVPERDH